MLGGFTDWSLPTTIPAIFGYNQIGSQMGDLFYNQLGGVAEIDLATTHNGYYNLFTNVQTLYWSDSEYAPYLSAAWYFSPGNGNQGISEKFTGLYAWAVRSGDVAAVPVPAAIWLFTSGLSLFAFTTHRRENKNNPLQYC